MWLVLWAFSSPLLWQTKGHDSKGHDSKVSIHPFDDLQPMLRTLSKLIRRVPTKVCHRNKGIVVRNSWLSQLAIEATRSACDGGRLLSCIPPILKKFHEDYCLFCNLKPKHARACVFVKRMLRTRIRVHVQLLLILAMRTAPLIVFVGTKS